MKTGRHIVGLDIGTTKVCAVVGRSYGAEVEIEGVGYSASSGMKNGAIVDIEAMSRSIKAALTMAEDESGIGIKTVYAGLACGQIECIRTSGASGIRGRAVGIRDIESALDAASSVYVPLEREVVHVIPFDYGIDGQEGIRHPSGMAGAVLEARVNIITVTQSASENIFRACEKAGLKTVEIVLEPLASARAVLTPEEMEYGALLIDIGGGTTDLAVYKDGRLRHTGVIPVGGNHFTSDVSIGLRISRKEAERLKIIEGSALRSSIGASETMRLESLDGKAISLPRHYMADILGPRAEEVAELIKERLDDGLIYCAVLTGGASLLNGMDRIMEAVLGMPVRLGSPTGVTLRDALRSPVYSTGIGLMLYGHDIENETRIHEDVLKRMASWITGFRIFGGKN